VSLLNARRLLRDVEHERQRVTLTTFLRNASNAWHGVRLHQPDWGDGSHSVALGGELRKEGLFFHLILNAYWGPLDFELPTPNNGSLWRRWIDTSLDSPDDIVPWRTAPAVPGNTYRVGARSVVMLFTGTGPDTGPSMTGGSGGVGDVFHRGEGGVR
jgi:glycogen operon protein